MPEFKTQLQRDYIKQRDLTAEVMPNVHRFLVSLEALCAEDPRFHLGTTKNLYLYAEDRLLSYVTLGKLTTPDPTLKFTSNPNADLKEGTRIDPRGLLRRPLNQLVMKLDGYRAGWAKHKDIEGVFWFTAKAPETFFDATLDLIRTAVDHE
jgi:hypothetical protein